MYSHFITNQTAQVLDIGYTTFIHSYVMHVISYVMLARVSFTSMSIDMDKGWQLYNEETEWKRQGTIIVLDYYYLIVNTII